MHAEWVEDPDAVPAPEPTPTPTPTPTPAPAPEPEPTFDTATYELDVRTAAKVTTGWTDAGFIDLGEQTIDGVSGTLYAGINKATMQVQIGMMTTTGWVVLEQASTTLVKNTWYDLTVTTFEDTVTVAVNGKVYLTYDVVLGT
jgi:hypothetical protein